MKRRTDFQRNTKRSTIVLLILVVIVSCADKTITSKEPEVQTQNCTDAPVIHRGYATFYTWADGRGNCGFDATPNDLMVGAMNQIDYAGSAVCGSCAVISGPRGEVTIRIVDRCPECVQGDIDLSPQAFARIADTTLGRVPITWKFVPCNLQGNIIYHFKDGSNQWWTAVQIRNHRYRIARLEYMTTKGTYQIVYRQSYNYFVEPTGMGPGPYTFRVTDIYGHVLVDSGIPHVENGNVAGAGQFPVCSATDDENQE